jgi:Sec-independent protein translocase protein TatA
MFGISWGEFFVIVLVGVIVIPAGRWPDVARFLARVVRFVRGIIWKITDASENIKTQIELEKPIDDLIQNTTNDVLDTISTAIKKPKKTNRKGA